MNFYSLLIYTRVAIPAILFSAQDKTDFITKDKESSAKTRHWARSSAAPSWDCEGRREMVTKEEPVTAHQSWNWFHANPSIARRRLWAALSYASWLQPRGGHLPVGLVEAQCVPARRLPHSSRIVRERVARSHGGQKVPNSQLQSKLHLETAAVLQGNRAGAWDRCLYLQSQTWSYSYQRANVENITIPHFLLRRTPRSRLLLLQFWMFTLTQQSSQEKD